MSKVNHSSKLETLVKIIAPIFLIVSIILISQKTITGNAVKDSSFINTIPIIVILLISLIFIITIEIKRKR